MKLAQYLKKTKLSLSEFARRCDIPRTTLQNVLDETQGVTATTAKKIILATSGLVGLDDLIAKRPRAKREPKVNEG
jgi:predicted transcriptional regulator